MKPSFLKHILFVCLILLKAGNVYAATELYSSPDDSIFSYMQRAMRFNELFPQEKVYLHFDNTGYFKGETMWFQAYVVRADNGQLSDLSKIVYVELLDPSGNIIEKRNIKIEDGIGYGDIKLDNMIYVTGFYEVRAYTRYMTNWAKGGAVDKNSAKGLDKKVVTSKSWLQKVKKNEDTSYLSGIFSRVFPIFKKPEKEGNYAHPSIDTLSYRYRLPEREYVEDTVGNLEGLGRKGRKAKNFVVNFYPEGGDLVKGMHSRVAFEVIDRNTLEHQKVVGMVTNKKGDVLAITPSGKNGRGIFEIIPDTNDLELIITDSNRKKHEFELPTVKDEGCVVRMNTLDDAEITTLLQCSPALVGRKLGYVVMNEGNIVLADTVTAEPYMNIAWRRAEMKPGVNQFTVFTADGHIQAERRFFICPLFTEDNNITISVDSDSVLKPCGKVRLNLNTAPNAHLSFSAMDAGTLNNGKQGDIRTYMLLGSDIRGYIAHPEYYFEKDDRQHRMAADTLMLVQGWRRYNWEQMTDPQPMSGKHQIIEDKQYVYGRIGDSQSVWLMKNHPIDSVQISAILWNFQQQKSLSGKAITDSLGNYAFGLNEDVYGDYNMDLKTRIGGKLKTFTITIDRQFRPSVRTIMKEESQQIVVPQANLFEAKKSDSATETDDEDEPYRIQVGKREFITKTVKVKKKKNYWTDPGIGWYGEDNAQRFAQIYYDVEDIVQGMLDRGEIVPTIEEFLENVNPFFKVTNHALVDSLGHLIWRSGPFQNVYYNNRNVSEIIGNYLSIPYATEDYSYMVNNTEAFNKTYVSPIYLDEVKSIYICHHPATNEYQVWIFPYPTYSTESNKGRRITHFYGYSIPSKFEMEDYTNMPPMEDFRRTLYWAPNLQTDVTGRATVEFFNNSSCKHIFVSAEGIGHEGGFIAYDKTHAAYKLEEIKADELEGKAGTNAPDIPDANQPVNVQAIVIDKNTRERIPHAHVYVDAENGTMTNLDGQFVVTARRSDQIRVSFVGYETLAVSANELTLASDSIMPVLALSPAENMLSEVVVEPVDHIIRQLIASYDKEYKSKKNKSSRFYYRQTTNVLDNCTEYTEAFFNANSNFSIRNLGIVSGRYAYIDHDSLGSYTNVNNFQFLTELPVRGNGSKAIEPLNNRYKDFYDISYETLSSPTTGKPTHYKIHFTPKPNITATIIEATLYVSTLSRTLERYEGTVHNLQVRDASWKRFPILAHFDISYTRNRKFTEVQSVVVDATAMYDGLPYQFSSMLFNTGRLKEKQNKFIYIHDNLRKQIDTTTYDPTFWKNNEIVKRTDLENSIIEMMEKKELFSNYK